MKPEPGLHIASELPQQELPHHTHPAGTPGPLRSDGQTMSEATDPMSVRHSLVAGGSGIEDLAHRQDARGAATLALRREPNGERRFKSAPASQGFSRDQLRKLMRDVDGKHVHSREFDGKTLTYIEGWYAIAQANAIFGHAGWDREMVHFERVMERVKTDSIVICGYMARVRLRVRAGSTVVIREGTGWGSAVASTATAANERALKAAETDATKRALSTFGASFGLRLYDKDHVPIRPRPLFTLYAPDGKVLDGTLSPEAFSTGVRQLIELCKDTHQVDQLSRHNRASLTDLRLQVPTLRNAQGIHFADLLLRLMQKRRDKLGGTSSKGGDGGVAPAHATSGGHGPDGTGAADEAKRQVEKVETEKTSWGGPTNINAPPPHAGAPIDTSSNVEAGDGSQDGGAAHIRRHNDRGHNGRDGHTERARLGPGDAFLRFTGQPARRWRPYPFPTRSHMVDGKEASALGGSPPRGPVNPGATVSSATAPTEVVVATTPQTAASSAPNHETKNALQMVSEARSGLATAALEKQSPEPATPSKIAFGLKIDKSKLLLGLERRIRDKAHLRRVAELPCLICNRQPSHAHHLRFAQRRGLSQKVSDEYVVPLCALHHGDLHRASSEQEWWSRQKIDPIPVSLDLWGRHRSRH